MGSAEVSAGGTVVPPQVAGPTVRVPTNLPVPLTSFTGREAETAAVRDLLAAHRLVTLTGPGGAGKTRLAQRAAAGPGATGATTGAASPYPDGVWWVDLATRHEPGAVAEATAEATGVLVEPVHGARHALVTQLAAHRALVCLDNAEHLLDGVAAVAEALLRGCPGVTVLVTSREPLGLAGEAVFGVPPMEDDEAVALFVDRARLVRPGFALDDASDASARRLVRHLDGIPLALELAAAWLRTLSVTQVEAGLDDRFRLLVRGPRGAQRRQRTLAGSLDWSHALLDETDRAVLRRLAVCAGTFGLDAVRAVGAGGDVAGDDVLPALGRLVDKSLVVAEEQDGEVRYRLLETVRAYATARLVEAHEDVTTRSRHLAWAAAFAETADAERERDPDAWRRTLLREYDNLRAALDHGLPRDAATDADAATATHAGTSGDAGTSGEAEAARRLAAALAWLWHVDRRGREGLAYLRRALDRAPSDRSRRQARLLTGVALVADTADPLDVEYDAATRALALATEVGDESMRALCLNLAAVGAFYTDFDAAWARCEEAYAAAEAGGNHFVRGGARALQAIVLHLRDRHVEAEARVDATVRRDLWVHRGVLSTVLGFQAEGALRVGDVARAQALAAEALRLAEPLGDYLRVGAARSVRATVLTATGDLDGADAALAPVLRLADGDSQEVFVPGLGAAVASLALRRGDPATALPWLRREVAATDGGVETWLAARALPLLGTALARLGRTDEAADVLARAVAVARDRDMPGPLAEAYDAQAALAATDPDALARATDLAHEALTLRVAHDLRASWPDSLETLARLGAAVRPTPDDVRVLAAADASRRAMRLPRPPHAQTAYDTTVAALREALGDATVDGAVEEGARLTLDEAVAYARRARGARGRPDTGWDSLTPTEREVVRLVAEGLSNPDIGARLFMSRGTVKTHLSHVYAKLGTANRTELASAATERGVDGRS